MLALSVLSLLREKYLLAYVPRVLLYYSGRGVYSIETDMNSDEIKDILANITGNYYIIHCVVIDTVVQLYRMIFVRVLYLLYIVLCPYMIIIVSLCLYNSICINLMFKLNRHLI